MIQNSNLFKAVELVRLQIGFQIYPEAVGWIINENHPEERWICFTLTSRPDKNTFQALSRLPPSERAAMATRLRGLSGGLQRSMA